MGRGIKWMRKILSRLSLCCSIETRRESVKKGGKLWQQKKNLWLFLCDSYHFGDDQKWLFIQFMISWFPSLCPFSLRNKQKWYSLLSLAILKCVWGNFRCGLPPILKANEWQWWWQKMTWKVLHNINKLLRP